MTETIQEIYEKVHEYLEMLDFIHINNNVFEKEVLNIKYNEESTINNTLKYKLTLILNPIDIRITLNLNKLPFN